MLGGPRQGVGGGGAGPLCLGIRGGVGVATGGTPGAGYVLGVWTDSITGVDVLLGLGGGAKFASGHRFFYSRNVSRGKKKKKKNCVLQPPPPPPRGPSFCPPAGGEPGVLLHFFFANCLLSPGKNKKGGPAPKTETKGGPLPNQYRSISLEKSTPNPKRKKGGKVGFLSLFFSVPKKKTPRVRG